MTKTLTPDLKTFVFFLSLIFVHILQAQRGVDYKPSSEWAWGIEDSTEYFIYTPGNLELGKKYPIALYLHGCCGDSPNAIPHRAADPPVRMWHNFTENTQDIPTYIISPQTTRGWSQHFESLKKVIDFLVEKRQGDPQRIYIVGFSMGGRGLYQFISDYPDYFAAAIPIGMSFFDGDFEKVKDIPIWANQGEVDRWAREMPKFVRETRALNGLELDSAWQWVTGVNPKYTSFEGMGHIVQWEAASQDLTEWAYSKINDGNKYPQAHFKSPSYREEAKEGKNFNVEIDARDPDGEITKVDLFVNRQFHSSLTAAPFKTKIKPESGDNLLEAVAYDNKGKSITATTVIAVDTEPQLNVNTIPYGRVGGYYSYWLPALGNGVLAFEVTGLPAGLKLLKDGWLKGIPLEEGTFSVNVTVTDEDGDVSDSTIKLVVKGKREGEVLVTDAKDFNGDPLVVSKAVYGETPNFNRKKAPTSAVEHISFSDLDEFYGLSLVKSEESDTTLSDQTYMTFTVSEPVEVLVGYEVKDNMHSSGIPAWLKDFKRIEETEIVAQIRYYGIFSKKYPKGEISLPGGDRNENGVSTNYFVMVRAADFNNEPEINMDILPSGEKGKYYASKLTSLYGNGKLNWEVISGDLPADLRLELNGSLVGTPQSSGSYSFIVEAVDEMGQSDQSEIQLEIK